MVAVIRVDIFSFSAFSAFFPVALSIQKLVFSGCTVLPDSKEIKLRSSD